MRPSHGFLIGHGSPLQSPLIALLACLLLFNLCLLILIPWKSCTTVGCPPWGCNVLRSLTAVCEVNLSVSISVVTTSESCIATWLHVEFTILRWLIPIRQACSPLIQLFFGFASDIDQTNINRDIRDGNWLSRQVQDKSTEFFKEGPLWTKNIQNNVKNWNYFSFYFV